MQNVANGQQVTVVNACLFQLEDRCACFFDFWKRRVAARSFVFETVFAAAVSGGRWDGQRLRFESLRPYANNDLFRHNAWASNRRRACLLVLAVFALSSVSNSHARRRIYLCLPQLLCKDACC